MPAVEEHETDSTGHWSLVTLFEQLETPLLGYAYQLVKRADIAQDLVQEAFLQLHRNQSSVKEPKPWLYRTIHNLAMNYHRKENRIIPLPDEGPQDDPNSPTATESIPDEHLSRIESIGQLRLAIKKLEHQKQELLRLKFEEELSYKEISARMGLSVGNVGYQLHHLIKSLAAELSKAGILQ